jgi:hypothetical protein
MKMDNGFIGEGRELKINDNRPVITDYSSFNRLATPLFLEFIVARSLATRIRQKIESSDRRVRNTVETLL